MRLVLNDEPMVAYIDDEMIDDENGRSVSNEKEASEEQSCVIEQNNKKRMSWTKKTYSNRDAVGCLCA